MKRTAAILVALAMLSILPSCAGDEPALESVADSPPVATGAPDEMSSADGNYPVAVITDGGELRDGAFNEKVWDAAKQFAVNQGIGYKYYIPSGAGTVDDHYEAMKAAAEAGAEIALCTGVDTGAAFAKAASVYPGVNWVWVDGSAVTDVAGEPMPNTLVVSFDEEACGFFAGYALVKDGFTKLGFAGGGAGLDPACCKCGYGFVQGANAAGAEMGVQVEMNYSWLYGAALAPSPQLKDMLSRWYESGTEVIFPCGGTMLQSAVSAANDTGGWAVGFGSDQAGESDRVLTSAVKDVGGAAFWALNQYYSGGWDTLGGTVVSLGVADGAVLLPAEESSWRFRSFSLEDYQALFDAAMVGELSIDGAYPEAQGKTMGELEFSNVGVTMVE